MRHRNPTRHRIEQRRDLRRDQKGQPRWVFGYLALLRIHLKHTLILSALAIVGFLLALLHHEVSTTVLVQDLTEIMVTALMGSTANWLLESESRTGYLLNYDLTQKVGELRAGAQRAS